MDVLNYRSHLLGGRRYSKMIVFFLDEHMDESPVSSECQPSQQQHQQQQVAPGGGATTTSVSSSSAPAVVTTSPPCASGGGEHHPLSGGVDMRSGVVRVADEYTKRKHVARVSAARPCRSEFLLQADGGAEEFADWVRALQRQAAHATDAELDPSASRQQAVPQLIPASTTIQVQGSHLSPQLSKTKATSSRNRSPTGQSPVSKSRKPSQVTEASTSPKSKTWRGRMVKQFRKFNQGGNSPSSPTAPEGSTFGVALEDCLPSAKNMYIPRFVEVCTDIIDERGLQTVGIYRVPGNNASITALTEEINRNYEDIPLEDPRWNDLHVVSSLLKSYFRKMPDSLVTVHLYPHFIKADKIEDPKARLEELRRLVRSLPKHNYHTLRHIIMHLKRVADNCHMNRMEAKNLAIVFGPTIVRPEGENMETMVNHMTNQCKIVESLLTHAEWFFPENENEENHPVPLEHIEGIEEFESANNQALLLHNISKYEALKDQKEKNGALFSSIISAAQRKVKRKPQKSSQESKDEPTSPTSLKAPVQPFSPSDLKETSTTDGKSNEETPHACMDVEKKTKQQQTEKVPWFNYSTDKDEFHRRIQNFKQETEAMLQLPRKTEISVNNIDTRTIGQLSSSAGNVHHQPSSRLSLKATSNNGETMHVLTKTHSACNVFSRTSSGASSEQQQLARNSMDGTTFNGRYSTTAAGSVVKECRKNGNVDDIVRMEKCNVRRGSSMENVNAGTNDSSNGGMKKVKYENENEGQRSGSLDSLNKLVNEDGRSSPSPPLRGWRPVRPPNIPPQRPPRTRHMYNNRI
ncbi:unnamed protein product [Callosobruchus maculatus]|uniref:Rho-GAP domain-containing protein n=1 Tax=Callosobruchus maculatus TaxID=64391 RepID=A0A653CK97_CALMS|nr:unnamed protein product [Callosobruchus maculatus]